MTNTNSIATPWLYLLLAFSNGMVVGWFIRDQAGIPEARWAGWLAAALFGLGAGIIINARLSHTNKRRDELTRQ